MITLGRITQQADADGVDADTVERDYVLTHLMASLSHHPDNAKELQGRDPLMASILTAAAVHESLHLASGLNGQWTPRDKDLQVKIESVCPQVVEPLRTYQENSTPGTANSALKSIPGVSTFFEWESDPDPV
jgi:hypothetical protein